MTWRFWFRVHVDFALWIFGVQEKSPFLKLDSLHLYCSPLQAIAVGYFFGTSLCFLSARLQIVVTALLLFATSRDFVHFETKDGFGDWRRHHVCQHTLAEWVDHVDGRVMECRRDASLILPGMTLS